MQYKMPGISFFFFCRSEKINFGNIRPPTSQNENYLYVIDRTGTEVGIRVLCFVYVCAEWNFVLVILVGACICNSFFLLLFCLGYRHQTRANYQRRKYCYRLIHFSQMVSLVLVPSKQNILPSNTIAFV